MSSDGNKEGRGIERRRGGGGGRDLVKDITQFKIWGIMKNYRLFYRIIFLEFIYFSVP